MGYICKASKVLIILGLISLVIAALSSSNELGNYAYFFILGGTLMSIISMKYDFQGKLRKGSKETTKKKSSSYKKRRKTRRNA